MTATEIRFYSTKDEYGCFSNFAGYRMNLDGKWWPTVEHYFQAQKFDDPAYREKIRTANSSMLAARLGRSRKVNIRRDWESAKLDVMRKAVLAKFTAHEEIGAILLATGDAQLVEETTRDTFWGCGSDGAGQNWLGQILMEVREQLQKIETNQDIKESS